MTGQAAKRVAHVLWHSYGGMRRHVRTVAAHPPCGWATAGVFGPASLKEYFDGLPFHAVGRAGLLRAGRDADVIHAHGITAGIVALPRSRPPVVTSLHVVVGGSGRTRSSRFAQALAHAIAGRADAIAAASAAAAEGFPRARVIAPAFDPLPPAERDRAIVRSELGASQEEVVAVCVSRLDADKRIDLFIDAVGVAGCVGWVVGDGPEMDRLEALARGTRVRFLGYRSDVSDLLAAADLFALPSDSESYGIAVAEAIAAGLPVVATRTGALEAIVGDAGVLVKPGDDDAFAAAVHRVANDGRQRSGLASLARDAVRPDRGSLIAALGGVYEDVLRRRGR